MLLSILLATPTAPLCELIVFMHAVSLNMYRDPSFVPHTNVPLSMNPTEVNEVTGFPLRMHFFD